MRAHAHDRRRAADGGGRARSSRAWRHAGLAGGLTAAVAALAATAAGAPFKPQTVVVRDDGGDVTAPAPDITRVSVGRGPDGRIRAALTLGGAWTPRDLTARSGPPGSLCLRLWTASTPPNSAPDYLVCATAEADGRKLRAAVFQERPNTLPVRVAPASVSRRGTRSAILRFSQSAVGRPALLRFAAEATRAGCTRPSCVDTAPNAPATARIRLRRVTARTGT